jgi:hypothetical protein
MQDLFPFRPSSRNRSAVLEVLVQLADLRPFRKQRSISNFSIDMPIPGA